MLRFAFGAALVAIGLIATPASANDSDDWTFQLTPYLWLPTIDGSLKYSLPPGSGGSPEISVGPTDWLELLNAGLLLSGSATKGKFGLYGDVVYLSLTSKNDGRVLSVDDTVTVPGTRIPIPVSATLNLNTRSDLDGLQLSVAGGYQFAESEGSAAVVFAGIRYFDVDVSSSWDLTAEITVPGTGIVLPAQGQIGKDVGLVDGIVGIRGYNRLGQGKWTAMYYLDAGTGDSDLTWNAMAGLGYEFGWGELLFAYRHLEYDQSDNKLLQDFSFSGPGFGARFTFD
jgi:hypothetical protein